MKLFALIGSENKVVGLVQIEPEDIGFLSAVYGQVVDVTDLQPQPQLGWSFDGQNVVGTSASKKITKLAMRQRFTVTEMLAIMNASATTPIVKYLMDNLTISTYVDLSRSDTQAGLGVLVAYGLVTQDRVNIILSTPPALNEVYTG